MADASSSRVDWRAEAFGARAPPGRLQPPVPIPGSSDQQQPPEPRESRFTAFRNAKTVPDFDLLEIAQEQVALVNEFSDRSVDEWYDDAQQRENHSSERRRSAQTQGDPAKHSSV